MNIDILRMKIATENTRINNLKKEREFLITCNGLSDELMGACVKCYKQKIDECEINLCGLEEKLCGGLNDAADVMAEMKGEK